jgi:hypothetical protein
MDEYVEGFCSGDPEGLTPIDVVIDVTGLTYEEVKSCMKIVLVPEIEPDLPY